MELGENLKEIISRTTETIGKGVEAVGEAVSAPAKWVGEKVGDTAFEATGSPAVAAGSQAVGEVFGDPLNAIPFAKLGALGGVIKTFGGKKITEVLSDTSFAHIFADITGKKEDVKRVLDMGTLSPDIREQMLSEAVKARSSAQTGKADPKVLAGIAAGTSAALYSGGDKEPEPTPPAPYDPRSKTFWTDFKEDWVDNSDTRQQMISELKKKEFGDKLPEQISRLESLLDPKKKVYGDLRAMLRREYKDLTGKDYDATE